MTTNFDISGPAGPTLGVQPQGFDPVTYASADVANPQKRRITATWEDSYLYERWSERVKEPPSNDFVIAISASGKSSMSRTGKTTLTTYLAERCDLTESGFDAEENATLDAGDLAENVVPEVENRSAVVIDEAQGAIGTTGFDSRRSMKDEPINALNSILNNGNKQLTIFITSQHLPMLDKRLPPIIDAWLLIRHGPSSSQGPLAVHHSMHVDDYNFKDPKIKTPAHEDIVWPSVRKNNRNYRILEEMKEKAKTRNTGGDKEKGPLPKDVQAQIAQDWRNQGHSARWIADNIESISYGYSWIYEHTENPDEKDGDDE